MLREWFLHPNGALPGLRVELRRRQPAGPRDRRGPGLPDRRRHRHRLPRAGLPEAAAQLHLVAQPPGPRRQQHLRGRVPGPRQHQPDRPVVAPAGRAARAGGRDGVDGRLRPEHARDRPPARRGPNPVYDDMVVKFVEQYLMIVDAIERRRPPRPAGRLVLRPARRPGRRDADPGPDPRRRHPAAAGGGRSASRMPRPPGACGTASTASSAKGLDAAATGSRHVRYNADRRPGHALRRRARGAAARPGIALRRGRVPLAVRAPLALEAPRGALRGPGAPRGPDRATSPAEGRTNMYGGNSNWRGPDLDAAQRPDHPGPAALPPVPGRRVHGRVPHRLRRAAHPRGHRPGPRRPADLDLAARCPDGRRPVNGGVELLQSDPAWQGLLWFPEYFHGDTGAGLGAMHQTGWTAEVINLLLVPPRDSVQP